MKRTIQCTILCLLAIHSAFAGRPVPNFDSLHSRVVRLDGGGQLIGVYGLTGASVEQLPAQMGLNQRVDYFIQHGELLNGRLQMLVRSNVPGEFDELRPANRAILMFLRLNDVEGDVRYWLYEECLDSASNSIVENSLIDWLMYHMRDSLERFREIVTNQQPFSPLMNDGIYAAAADFTDEEYERMHNFFRRYVDLVERVLNPWREAWEGTHRNVQLQGAFWTLRMGDVLKFRTYAQAYVQMLPGNEGEPEGLENYAHANIRIGLIDQGPLNALIAMVIMDNMLNGMYGVWAELRDALNEQDYDDMLRYRTPQQAGQEDPEDAVHRRLAVLNALLQVDELVPIEGYRQDQRAFNRNVARLYREIQNHVLLLYRYANPDTRRDGDWEAFMQTGRMIDTLIDAEFPLIGPLDFEDEEADDDGSHDEGNLSDGYLDRDERAWWLVYGTHGGFPGGRNLEGDEQEEIDYPDEDLMAMDVAGGDDDEGGNSDYRGPEVETEEGGLVDSALRAGTNAAVPALAAFFTYVHGRQGHGGCR